MEGRAACGVWDGGVGIEGGVEGAVDSGSLGLGRVKEASRRAWTGGAGDGLFGLLRLWVENGLMQDWVRAGLGWSRSVFDRG